MAQLKNRNMAIPNGIVYRQPETGFQPPTWSAFDAQVQAVTAYRRANPFLVQKHGWSTDPAEVAREVDEYLAKVCEERGWSKYVLSGTPEVKKNLLRPNLTLPQRLGAVVAGAETLVEWLASGAEAVPLPLSEHRAEVCAKCPKNSKGGFESYFTRSVSEAIRREVSKRAVWNLSTTHDKLLGVCEACACPLKLKVHMPLDRILARLPDTSRQRLDDNCWILSEASQSTAKVT